MSLRLYCCGLFLISSCWIFAAEPLKSAATQESAPDAHPAPKNVPLRASGSKVVDGVYMPKIVAASNEGQNAIGNFKIPAGFKIDLFAAEPQLANPVAFCFDHLGRVFVCETFRQNENEGVEDNRSHNEWLNDDLASTSIEDRRAYIMKHRPDQGKSYTFEHDRIKLLEDRDGDHKIDFDMVYADGFNDLLDGTGAGVLAHKNDVYYTCIPSVYKLTDTKNTGKADQREVLSTGYGVKFAFRGHDMHGLTIGPDGRLYYSIGDRGLNVKTREGRHLYNPDSGAVLRCELDGSNLEIFCTGLRNPQELAFDDLGNLFTVDNNSDSGDKARLYHLVQGGDYGWRMYYQYLPDRGPWNREMLWGLPDKNQSYSVIPPIAHITDGPSGLAAYPGTGLGNEYNGSFFICDFRGGPANSAVRRFTMEPDGATFILGKYEPFFERVLATDCAFGPDGAFYVSDWVNGWGAPGKGRIHRVTNEATTADPRVQEVQSLLNEGFDQRPAAELAKLLGHVDRRVRMGAQFALVEKKAVNELLDVAKNSKERLARLHAIWGLGMVLRLNNPELLNAAMDPKLMATDEFRQLDKAYRNTLDAMKSLCQDADKEVAAQAIQALCQSRSGKNSIDSSVFRSLLNSGDERVVYLLTSSGFIVDDKSLYDDLLMKYGERSPTLRWTLTNSRVNIPSRSPLFKVVSEDSPVHMRRAISAYSLDGTNDLSKESDPVVVLNTAIRYSDYSDEQPLRNSMFTTKKLDVTPLLKQLAALISKPYAGSKEQYDALFRRILNANFRLGKAENAAALADYAGRSDVPEKLRIEALDMLLNWAEPKPIDRVTGQWRPLEKRSAESAKTAIAANIGAIFAGPDKVRQKAAEAAGKLGISDINPQLLALLADKTLPGSARAAALEALAQLKEPTVAELTRQYLGDKEQELRLAATKIAVRAKPADAVSLLNNKLQYGPDTRDVQQAIELLRGLQTVEGDEALVERFKRLNEGLDNDETVLDLLEAARDRASKSKYDKPRGELKELLKQYLAKQPADEKLAAWLGCAVGGNAEQGKKIFYEKINVSCVRCHKIGETGGEVGPILTQIGKDKTRQYLLEAIVDPNRAVAQGFETVVLELKSGQVVSGIIKKETPTEITLVDANAKTITVKTAEVEDRQKGLSSMPADVSKELTPFEVRDLVEFLQGLK